MHSPAPWILRDETILSADGYFVATVHGGYPEAAHDRALLLSAPQMLAALKQAKDALVKMPSSGGLTRANALAAVCEAIIATEAI